MGQRLRQFRALAESQHAHPCGFGIELEEQAARGRDLGGKDGIARISQGRSTEAHTADADLRHAKAGAFRRLIRIP